MSEAVEAKARKMADNCRRYCRLLRQGDGLTDEILSFASGSWWIMDLEVGLNDSGVPVAFAGGRPIDFSELSGTHYILPSEVQNKP